MSDTTSLIARYASKASGTYRELIDATGSEQVNLKINVVVLIQSEQGPVMNAVYVEDQTQLHAIFGRRNMKLEQRGSFGILMAEHVLEQGPCWVINVKNINQYTEVLDVVQFACNTDEVQIISEFPISDVYDTTKFWKTSKYFGKGEDFSAFSIASVQGETVSVILIKDKYSSAYDETIAAMKEAYPKFAALGLDDDAYISDYMVTAHVFKSDLTGVNLSTAGLIQNGMLNKDALVTIASDKKAKYFGSYTGTIGDVLDMSGNNLNIATKINAETLNSGIFASVNNYAIMANPVDLMVFGSIEMPKIYSVATRTMPTKDVAILGHVGAKLSSRFIEHILTKTAGASVDTLRVMLKPDAIALADDIKLSDLVKGLPIVVSDANVIRVKSVQYIAENRMLSSQSVIGTTEAPVMADKTPFPKNSQGVPVYPIGHPWAKQPVRWKEGEDKVILTAELINGSLTEGEIDVAAMTFTQAEVDVIAKVYGTPRPILDLAMESPVFLPVTEDSTVRATIDGATGDWLSFHGYAVLSWTDSISAYPIQVLRGIRDLPTHYVDGTSSRQNDVLAKLNDAGITEALCDPTIFKCRYMVDSFKTYIEPNAKYQLATLAAKAKRFPVFTPFPFYESLLLSRNPDFKDSLGAFKMKYVKEGKNPDKISSNSFSFPADVDAGAPWLIPVMNVEFNDGFAGSIVPGTGAAAKAYYSKHFGTKRVYDIVGGTDFPIAASGVVGPEETFGETDRGYLESIGVNVLLKLNGILQFRSSRTAYQAVNSALNSPETIEKFLYLSDNVEPVIDGKLFKFNNIDSRTAVKNKADNVCLQMKADGAIYDYENICDLSNNGVEVRKQGIILLDSILYNEFGIRIGVHRTTLKLPEA